MSLINCLRSFKNVSSAPQGELLRCEDGYEEGQCQDFDTPPLVYLILPCQEEQHGGFLWPRYEQLGQTLAKGLITQLPLGTRAVPRHRAAQGWRIVCALRHTLSPLGPPKHPQHGGEYSFSLSLLSGIPWESTESRTAGTGPPGSQSHGQCNSGYLLPTVPVHGSSPRALLQQDRNHLSPSFEPARTAGAQEKPPIGSWRDLKVLKGPQVAQDLKASFP